MTITEMVRQAHVTAKEHGFWDDVIEMCEAIYDDDEMLSQYINRVVGCDLMLIVSELGEAVEAWRKADKENFIEEMADVFIRSGDLIGFLRLDLEQAIIDKMAKNESRPYKHGKAF